MRVLFLRRQDRGEFADCIDDWARALRNLGHHVGIEDAGFWIPNEISKSIDKETTKQLKEIGRDYDLVHAFGIRAAWACAEAYGEKEAWLYTAFEPPKSTHRLVVNNLNKGVKGLAVSRYVRNLFSGADVERIETLSPGIDLPQAPLRDSQSVRAYYKLPPDGLLVGASYAERIETSTPGEDGIASLILAWPQMQQKAHLVLIGEGDSDSLPYGVTGVGRVGQREELISACDLWVVPGRNIGFSREMLVAMGLNKPVLVRGQGGLSEQIAEDVSGFMFYDDEVLANRLDAVLEMELTREAVGNAALVRVEELYSLKESAKRLKDIYQDILQRN